MATCYDCIHCDACSDAGDSGFSCLKEDVSKCKHFKNKADFVEVKHGEWIDNHCSVCGMTPLGEELWEHLNITPPKFELCMDYCPCCGAKMDGGKKE